MNRSAILALCAAAVSMSVGMSAPAIAQKVNRNKACNDEWAAMKANNTVGDKKYADFRKECLARTAVAAPGEASAATPGAPPAATAPAPKPAAKPTRTAAPAPSSAPAAAGEAVFPNAVSDKYSSEKAGLARMHTCRDQYQENKANNANGGLVWNKKGGAYYSECNKHLKGEG